MLFILLLIPVIVAVTMFLFFKTSITFKEFILQLSGSLVVILLGWGIASCLAIQDVEHLHGRITHKGEDTTGCCHCTDVCTSTDKDGNCTSTIEVCSHSQDYEWWLETTVGNISVERCSGSSTPPSIWVNAQLDEPVTIEHTYKNYLKADKDSLIVHEIHGQFLDKIPDYPEIYNLYKRNPIISIGPGIMPEWQNILKNINADLGSKKQVDIVVILTWEKSPVFAQALEAKWLYGPKNSLIIVLGLEQNKINWTRVVTFSKVESLKTHLRDQLQGKVLSSETFRSIGKAVDEEFERTPMAEFEYLAYSATPSTGVLIFLGILGFIVSIGLGYFMHREDVFKENYRKWKRW